ncbi:MAG: hypothetical protein A2075_12005 [Geobacteraceae bacterium GWC2_58_44]|nr:MAG: hypothetical protein A2075_12005 [Geobacteraceae bacterium GWC2_58_44]HBG06286.1 hypothetical protein [Geobacter sp.]
MAQNRLNRILKILGASTEAFRGVDMDAYLALGKAAHEVSCAIEAAEKANRKVKPIAVPLAKALFG